MRERRSGPAAVGASSLLVIFAVLCLTVFALLALSTVRAGRSMSESACTAVEDYYAAECRAEEILARLRGGEQPAGVTREGDVYSYSCPISGRQALTVQVRLDGAEYEIVRWQAVSTLDWQADDSLPVWDGEAE